MLSKEEILAYVQQGQALPEWKVMHPKGAYLTRQALIYGGLAAVLVILTVVFLSQGYSYGYWVGTPDDSTLQIWRYIDLIILGLLFVTCLFVSLRNVWDLSTIQAQVLVLMPDGFLLKKRKTEQFITYVGVTTLSVRAGRYGDVTLNIRPVGSNVVYKVQFDSRYGNASALASQIVGAQRQFVARQRASVARPQ